MVTMVPADETDDLIEKDLPKAFELLREMNDNAVQVAHLVDEMLDRVKRGELSTAKGLSFLEVKYHMLLSYLINLTYVVLRKCTGEPIEADPAIDRLVELRTVLEKTRPIDHKLKYQVDKLVKAAVTGVTSQDDPTNFKANPDNLIAQLDQSENSEDDDDDDDATDTETVKKSDKKGVYVPPKIASVSYDLDDTRLEREKRLLERAKKRNLSSTIMQELREEYLDTPVEVGVGAIRGASSRNEKEREEYEENYFTRLQVSKTERHKMKRKSTLGTLTDELQFSDLTALDSRPGRTGKKRKFTKSKGRKNIKKKRFM